MIFVLLLIIMGVMGALEDLPKSVKDGMTPTLSLNMDNIDKLPSKRAYCNITLDEHILIHCQNFVLLDSFKRVLASKSGKIYNSDVFD
jgi:hypothetical protein